MNDHTPQNIQLLVQALSSTRSAVAIADAAKEDMPLIYVNQAFLDLTGYSEGEVINNNCRFLQGRDTDASAVAELRSAIEQRTDVRTLLKNYRKDGTYFWNDLVMSPVFDGVGALTHYIGFQLDVTQKVEREEKERRALELEQENAKLKQEAEMLARLNEVKDDFISIASHQLRTPATVVKQNLGMIAEGYLGEVSKGQKKAIDAAYQNNNRLIDIINELLRQARVSANDYVMNAKKVNLADILRAVKSDYAQKSAANSTDDRLKIIVDDDVVVKADADLLQSAIENLIDNALLYSYDDSAVTVAVTVAGTSVSIAVIDEGVGIADADKPKLFKRFSRIHTDHQFNIGGTGLGLYWVKTVAELHGGTVEVADNTPRGAIFTITFDKA